MSLEAALAANTAAVQALTQMLSGGTLLNSAAVAQQVAPAAAPFVPPAQPVAPPAAPPAMPPAPAWNTAPAAPPAAPAAPAGIPFNDTPSLVKYATDAYDSIKAKDPGVGAKIQAAFTTLGYADIQHVQPHHYQEFFNRVESLR